MYTPTQYRVENAELISEVIGRHPFATLLSQANNEIQVSHLPFLLDNDGKTLLCHMALANTQKIASGQTVQVLFHGPHAYISPALYPLSPDNVPTWNYVSVHVTGQIQIVEEQNDKILAMKKLIEHFENQYETGWKYENTPGQIALYCGITVFRVTNLSFQAKFKLSQNQTQETRDKVIRELASTGKKQVDAEAISNWMLRLKP